MAKRNTKTKAEQAKEARAEAETADSLDELDHFLNEFGPGFRVRLYRINPQTRRPEYVSSFDFAEMDLDTVREHFGGGTFQFRAYEHSGDGVIYRGSRTVDIAGPPRDLSAKKEEETTPARVERLELERQELADRLRNMTLEQRFEALARDLSAKITELRSPPAQAEQRNPVELAMEIVRNMGALRPHVEVPPAQPPQFIEILKLGWDMGREGGGGGTELEGYERVLDRFAPAILGLLNRGEARDKPEEERSIVEAAPMNLREALRPWIVYLVQWATARKDPAVRATVIADSLPALWLTELSDFLTEQGGSAITTLLGWYPELEPHRPWLALFLEELRVQLEEGPEEPEELEEATFTETSELGGGSVRKDNLDSGE